MHGFECLKEIGLVWKGLGLFEPQKSSLSAQVAGCFCRCPAARCGLTVCSCILTQTICLYTALIWYVMYNYQTTFGIMIWPIKVAICASMPLAQKLSDVFGRAMASFSQVEGWLSWKFLEFRSNNEKPEGPETRFKTFSIPIHLPLAKTFCVKLPVAKTAYRCWKFRSLSHPLADHRTSPALVWKLSEIFRYPWRVNASFGHVKMGLPQKF